jgi:hypothetical protein
MPTIPTATAAVVSVTEQTSKAAASNDDALLPEHLHQRNAISVVILSIIEEIAMPEIVCVIAVAKGGIMQKFAGQRPLRLLQYFRLHFVQSWLPVQSL